MDENSLDNQLLEAIAYWPGLGKLSATETLMVAEFVKVGLRGMMESFRNEGIWTKS